MIPYIAKHAALGELKYRPVHSSVDRPVYNLLSAAIISGICIITGIFIGIYIFMR